MRAKKNNLRRLARIKGNKGKMDNKNKNIYDVQPAKITPAQHKNNSLIPSLDLIKFENISA